MEMGMLQNVFSSISKCDSFMKLGMELFGMLYSLALIVTMLAILVCVLFYAIKIFYHLSMMIRDMISGNYDPSEHSISDLWK